MAEFKEVMKEAKRMCGHGCIGCSFESQQTCCKAVSPLCYTNEFNLEQFEDAVMKWAEGHPRKRYPTWSEWFKSISMRKETNTLAPCFFIHCDEIYRCFTTCSRLDEEIPEEFAIKANIQPFGQ